MAQCTIPGCARKQASRGWCMAHYKRHHVRGVPVPTGPEPQIGDPDGYGRYGIMERHETGALCHECGGWYASVGLHITRVHGMTSDEYRAAHGLARTQPLTSLATSRKLSERATARVGRLSWGKFEIARDPAAAARSRTPEVFTSAPATRKARAERAVDGRMDLHVAPRERVCPQCGTVFHSRRRTCSDACCRASRAARLERLRNRPITERQAAELGRATGSAQAQMIRVLQEQGYSSASIARAIGRSGAWMTVHYPRLDAHQEQ